MRGSASAIAGDMVSRGVTSKMIESELSYRGMPVDELRLHGMVHDGGELGAYSDSFLRRLRTEVEAIEADAQYAAHVEREEKRMHIYEEITQRFEKAGSVEELQESYKWLARQFVETNESAIRMEEAVIGRIGEDAYGELMYGSKEAYEKEKAFEEAMRSAGSVEEREALLLRHLLERDDLDEPEVPELFPEDEEDVQEIV